MQNKNCVLSVVLGATILVGSLAFSPMSTPLVALGATYSDVPDSYRYAGAINQLSSEGIIEGYSDGTFKPEASINRAEFSKIMIGAMGEVQQSEVADCEHNYTGAGWSFSFFPDVRKGEWYTPFVCMSKIKGVVKGYADGNFKPSNNINYVEALKIIYEANGDRGSVNALGEWYAPYLEDAKAQGIDLGIEAGKELTRGEMAQLIVNYRRVKPYQDPKASVNPDDFFLYQNKELGFQVMLPKELETYEVFPNQAKWDTCGNATYILLHFIPKAQADLGFRSYDTLNYMMPFNIGIFQASGMCNNGMTQLFDRDDWCSTDPYWCGAYRDLKFIVKGDYLYEFVPLYGDYGKPALKLFWTPKAGQMEYMRDSFEVGK